MLSYSTHRWKLLPLSAQDYRQKHIFKANSLYSGYTTLPASSNISPHLFSYLLCFLAHSFLRINFPPPVNCQVIHVHALTCIHRDNVVFAFVAYHRYASFWFSVLVLLLIFSLYFTVCVHFSRFLVIFHFCGIPLSCLSPLYLLLPVGSSTFLYEKSLSHISLHKPLLQKMANYSIVTA